MNIHAALLMIDFVCEHRFSEPRNDRIHKELLFAISELADSCLEAIENTNRPPASDKCRTEISLVRDFVEEALKQDNPEYAFSNIQGVSLRATDCPEDS